MRELLEQEDRVVRYVPNLREYVFAVNDGGTSGIALRFCPWCGKELPRSLRDEWFDRLEALGVDPAMDEIPQRFQSEEWWEAEPLMSSSDDAG